MPPENVEIVGVEGFLRFQDQLDEIWEDWRIEAEEFPMRAIGCSSWSGSRAPHGRATRRSLSRPRTS